MATGDRRDPYAAFRFLVEIEGLVVGGFSEVTGIQAETRVDELREGGTNDFVYKFPKNTEYPNLVLKRGITDSDVLWKWYKDVVTGAVKRKNGSVILLDMEGNEKWRWNFFRAFPVKWSGPDFRADSSSVAVETVELVHEGIIKG